MKHGADESSLGILAQNHLLLKREKSRRQSQVKHFRQCLRSVSDAGSDGECLEGRCPWREPRTTWRAKPLFDRRFNASMSEPRHPLCERYMTRRSEAKPR